MKLIVLIALVGCALAIPNPFPEEEYGPHNGLRIPGKTLNHKKSIVFCLKMFSTVTILDVFFILLDN